MSVVEVVDEAGYGALLASERLAVLHFWADFAAECRTVTAVLTELGTGVGLGHYSRIWSFPLRSWNKEGNMERTWIQTVTLS